MRRLLQSLILILSISPGLSWAYGSCSGTQVPYWTAIGGSAYRSSCVANTFYSQAALAGACAVGSCGGGYVGVGPLNGIYQLCVNSTGGGSYNERVLDSISSGCTTSCPSGTTWDGSTCVGNCAAMANTLLNGTGAVSGIKEGVSKGCKTGCEVGYSGVGVCISGSCAWTDAKYTGNVGSCVVGAPNAPSGTASTLVDSTTGSCTPSGGACVSTTKPNCAYVNGEYRCATATDLTSTNPCTSGSSGSVWCRSEASTPPKPNNGVAGMPATADAQFILTYNSSPTAISYYSATTVSRSVYDASTGSGGSSGGGSGGGSSGGTGTGGDTGGGSSGGGDGGGTGTGDGSGDGTGTLTGGPFTAPSKASVSEFAESLEQFQQAVASAPIVQAMADVADAVPTGGSPPSASFQAFGKTFTFRVPQEVIDAISSVLSIVMIAVWCLIAILVFMKA